MSDTNKQNSCEQKSCMSRTYEQYPPDDNVNAELRGRPVLYTGVVWIGILRRFLIPRRCDQMLPPPEQRPQDKPVAKSVSHSPAAIAPAEPKPLLQLASNPEKQNSQEQQQLRRHQRDLSVSPLASLMSQVQEASAGAVHQVQRLSQDLNGLVEDGKATTSDTIEAIRGEQALMLRCGAITVSGLVGYLSGLRRGAVTRLVYSATGATAMAAICYPQETRHYNSRGLAVVRQIIVFSVDLVRDGPQRILGKEIVDESEGEEQQRSENTKSRMNFGQIIKKLDSNRGENKFKTSTNIPTEEKQELTETQELSSQNHQIENPNIPDASSPASIQEDEKPTATDIANSIPYSPAIPAPPKMKSGDSQSYETHQYTENTLLDNVTATTTTENVHTRLQNYNLKDIQNKNDRTNATEATNAQYYQSKSHFAVDSVPIHEIHITEKETESEDEDNLIKNENLSQTEQHPLNKKLTRYYVKQPDEKLNTPEKGYDDLYSKRG
ncbi:uncharacterized protein LOC124359631 isoform X1 [Homalodisca vitripennis]|uniref:uncharacterized protein LOC124359631 isoform X1 n=1 Tax=Homalodisca vitripennis TaxID=197043 RepID=UPI001EEC32F5|nr:uncharacterized protein LOC124359631 isoform X1 [Homalodisca vitripennis]